MRTRRGVLGLTIMELVRRLRSEGVAIDHARLSRIERGLVGFSTNQLAAYARALECKVRDLIDEIE